MTRYVCLLRGVNVGGKGKVAMSALRETLESLGHTDVATYIQSGNAVFSASKRPTPDAIAHAIERDLGVRCNVMLRTHHEMRRALEGNPFPDADTTKLHIGFCAEKIPAAKASTLEVEAFEPDEVVVAGREIYYHLPNGMGRTKLAPYVDRRLKVPTTVRSWNTITKLIEMSSS